MGKHDNIVILDVRGGRAEKERKATAKDSYESVRYSDTYKL